MRRLIKIALIVLGIRAFLHWRKRRSQTQALEPVPAATEDPADELRRKLAESRDEDATAEPEAPAPVASVADRRAEVHEQGRATLDAMKPSDEG